jgi:uncharacterized protein YbjT (DUF2867 family)
MKIGVTGAFGFLGANFIAALLEGGEVVDALGDAIEITAFASRTRSNLLFDPRVSALSDLISWTAPE